jgi:general stress protein YciG
MDEVGGWGATGVSVAECRGLAEGGYIQGWLPDDAEADAGREGGGSTDGVEKEERQEAKEWERRGAPEGHPALVGLRSLARKRKHSHWRLVKRRFRGG